MAEDHRNFRAIEFLDERGVVSGYADGSFKPEGLVNRAEAMKIISIAFKMAEENKEYEATFPDVEADDWFFSYVMSAQGKAVVQGYPDGKFRPEQTVNLAETLKMASLAGKFVLPTEVKADLFADVKKDEWYATYALFARDKNVIFSDDYGNLSANQAMTRGKFCEVIYRLIRVLEADGKAYPIEENFSWFEGENLPFRIKYDAGRFEVFDREDEVVFLRPDREFMQFAETRLYPNSAVVNVTMDDNELEVSAEQYFQNLGSAFVGAKLTRFDFDGKNALEVAHAGGRATDIYVYLDNGDVLAVYTEYGEGILGPQLKNVIAAMLKTLEYKAVELVDFEELKSRIFAVILVEGKGKALIDEAGDGLIIETDSIGIGTGPVDYYYSAKLNLTMKLERGKDVILDTRDGQTSAF
ncbi:S-layer homology domain-containing protein [Candidatus Gracilibacteria bacterium]|nr:S-layer homology domain-containing protein [Candidatus Gracilibacteria bacterium]